MTRKQLAKFKKICCEIPVEPIASVRRPVEIQAFSLDFNVLFHDKQIKQRAMLMVFCQLNESIAALNL